ncbi:cob(I)yrinic acid a,c-diamide adenosyltransferase [Aquipuribacter hungaricus]|uniref:Corrinoid adenosyltransferase n=1 Tax=Aquipuribacter hungaricus TaxID=545624 RepID=A0ABV7WFE9_9MICO
MVILSRIYTKTGDAGTTDLGDMSRTHKTDTRLVAYADTDEANCAIGEVLAGAARAELDEDVAELLLRVQNDLFDVGADLCTPLRPSYEYPPLRVTEAYVTDLEAAIDTYNADLPKLRSFVLPGGTLAAALLHTARTVVRRAERSTWEALERYGSEAVPAEDGHGGVNSLTAQYLNRLSDLLFVLSRYANRSVGDVMWAPGGGRQADPGAPSAADPSTTGPGVPTTDTFAPS